MAARSSATSRDASPAPAMESPCRRQCALDAPRTHCTACGRTLAEIGAWASLSPAARRAIMDALPERLARWRAAALAAGDERK